MGSGSLRRWRPAPRERGVRNVALRTRRDEGRPQGGDLGLGARVDGPVPPGTDPARSACGDPTIRGWHSAPVALYRCPRTDAGAQPLRVESDAVIFSFPPVAPHTTRGGRVAEEAQGEAHIPAQQAAQGDPSRVPPPHEHPRRPGDRPDAPAEGSRPPLGLIGRVGDRASFDALRRDGRRARRGPVTVVHLPGTGEVRVAYAIGRAVGPAVVRNKLRRRLRAAVRELDVSTGGLPTGTYLVSLRPEAASASYEHLRRDLATTIAAASGDRQHGGSA
jgi:ribonuclease P protein component